MFGGGFHYLIVDGPNRSGMNFKMATLYYDGHQEVTDDIIKTGSINIEHYSGSTTAGV